jgi:multiple sugar transport system substrate-binding protein
MRRFAALVLAVAAGACAGEPSGPSLTFSASGLGAEADVVRAQLTRFAERHPGVEVELRVTPDAADQRHQLYVQWLNARAQDPDVLQLDIIWTAEFAGAGWIQPLDRYGANARDFFPAAIESNRWRGALYALPWFVDVGLLYWRTDLVK